MASKIALGKDTNSNVTYELPVSDTKYRVALAANTAATITIPQVATRAFFSFSSGTDVWVNYSTTATLPTGTFTLNDSELNPNARYGLIPGNMLSFISPTNAYVQISFFTDNINGY